LAIAIWMAHSYELAMEYCRRNDPGDLHCFVHTELIQLPPDVRHPAVLRRPHGLRKAVGGESLDRFVSTQSREKGYLHVHFAVAWELLELKWRDDESADFITGKRLQEHSLSRS
jgi:hypothetical protein